MNTDDQMRAETKQHLEECMRAFVHLVNALNEVDADPHWAAQLRYANIQLARARMFAKTGQVPQGEL